MGNCLPKLKKKNKVGPDPTVSVEKHKKETHISEDNASVESMLIEKEETALDELKEEVTVMKKPVSFQIDYVQGMRRMPSRLAEQMEPKPEVVKSLQQVTFTDEDELFMDSILAESKADEKKRMLEEQQRAAQLLREQSLQAIREKARALRYQPITVHAVTEEKTLQFGSCGCFYADENGCVDLSKQRSEAGTYTGVSPMGLFWSMKGAPGQPFGARLVKSNASTPLQVQLRVYDGHLTFEALYTDCPKQLSSLQFRRWYMAKGVRKIPIKSGRIRGNLFLPPGQGPFLGLIDMFGIVGSIVEFRAALLASRGFATLALPYFAFDDLPKYMINIELEYFLEAIQWLSDRPDVVSNQIGIIGVSKGGEIALHAAYFSPQVKAIVSINGAAFFTGDPMWYKGELIGQQDEFDLDKVIETDEGSIYKHFLVCKKEKYVPIWKKDVQVLLVAGSDDQALDPAHLTTLQSLYPANVRHNCKLLYYQGAGHLIEPPYSPLCRSSFRKLKGYKDYEGMITTLWGGSVEEHAIAQEDSWRRILHHFRTHLASDTNNNIDSKL